MIIVVNCYICEQPVPMDRALLIEIDETGSEGYFAHRVCFEAQDMEGSGY